MVVRKLRCCPVECVVRGYITGSGWKDYQATGAVSGIELPAGLRESDQLPEPIFTPVDQGRRRPRRGDRLRGRGRADRRPRAGRAGPRRVDRALRARGRPRARARDHPRRHEVRVRARRRRRADARRRGLHARLLALLARRSVRARTRAAELRQAVRARLGLVDRLGPHPAGAADPRRRRRAHAREVRRGVRADHRRAVRRLADAAPSAERPDARARARPAQGGDPRPPGPGGRAGAAGARLQRRLATSTSAG